MNERQTTREFKNYSIGKRSGKTYNKIQEMAKEIVRLQKELDKYKRLAEANLKDSQEFQDNMCNHRCIKNNEVLELKEELEKKDEEIDKLQKKEEQSQEILSRIKIIYQVHTKDCELTLKDIKKWEKILDK